jgi:hypothetical protein
MSDVYMWDPFKCKKLESSIVDALKQTYSQIIENSKRKQRVIQGGSNHALDIKLTIEIQNRKR